MDTKSYNNWVKSDKLSSTSKNRRTKNIERAVLYRTKPLLRINHDFYPKKFIKSS